MWAGGGRAVWVKTSRPVANARYPAKTPIWDIQNGNNLQESLLWLENDMVMIMSRNNYWDLRFAFFVSGCLSWTSLSSIHNSPFMWCEIWPLSTAASPSYCTVKRRIKSLSHQLHEKIFYFRSKKHRILRWLERHSASKMGKMIMKRINMPTGMKGLRFWGIML